MRPKADSVSSGRRSSALFGEAPSFDELRKKDRHRIDKAYRVTMVGFWYWFRVSLPITAPLLLVIFYLIPLFWFNATDGYIFFGGALSILFSVLALISYFHIPPWRRHPSSLMIQICFMSIIISAICMYNAYPSGQLSDLKDASDINLSQYSDRHDASCRLMSFFIQLTLLAREMWILTLSLDLLTSITNPFASYTQNIRKYHTFIWIIATISAAVLVFDDRCQGEFLNNGTCWLQVSGIHSACFWGYFMSWIIIFYINAMTVLTYAYSRITKGLESTFATRFAFVADTFRVVFFYFFYGLFLALVFILLYYYDDNHPRSALKLEHVLAFFISARGFFDALVWFFSHGFVNKHDKQNVISGIDSDNNGDNGSISAVRREFSIYASTLQNRRLFMKDVVTFSMIWSSFKDAWRKICCCCGNNHNGRTTSQMDDDALLAGLVEEYEEEEEDEEDYTDHEAGAAEDVLTDGKGILRKTKREGLDENQASLLENGEHVDNDIIEDEDVENLDLLLDSQRATSTSAAAHKSKQSHRQISFQLNDERAGDSGSESNSHNLGLSQSQSQSRSHAASSLRLTSSGQRKKKAGQTGSHNKKKRNAIQGRSSDLDVSPQLNLALREEVLSLVTQGIRESVKRMMLRDQQQHYQSNDVFAQSIYHPSSPPGKVGDRFDLSQSMHSQVSNDEFERIRLSDASERASPAATGKTGAKGGMTNTQSHSATKYRSLLGFLSYSFYPTNNNATNNLQTPAPTTVPTTQESRSHRTISNALHGLLSAVGAYIPGEYGVDPIHHSQWENHSLGLYSSSYTSSQQNLAYGPHGTGASYAFNPNMSHSVRPSVASSIYDDRGLPMMHPPGAGNFYAGGGGINPMRKVWGPPGTHSTTTTGQDDFSKPNSPVPGASTTTQTQQPAVTDPGQHSYAMGRSYQGQNSLYYSPSKHNIVPSTSQHYLLDTLAQVAAAPTTTQSVAAGHTVTPGGTGVNNTYRNRRKPPPAEVIFLLNGTHPFRDFRPSTFQRLRQIGEIDEEHYLECISQPTHEKLSEGKSGAFFFLCGDGEIVVKTVEKEEAMTLLGILDQYVNHLINNPHSLLVRFLGLHSIKMYGNEFYFVVMKNIFPQQDPKNGDRIHLNEKYDIKGSWVQRHGSMPSPGKICTCRHCGEEFIEGGPSNSLLGNNDMCTEVVGGHEAMVTLKDNDLITKIRLYPEDAFQIIDTLYSDSDALCTMGVMDYSLLVGVRHARYDVDTLHRMQQYAPQQLLYPDSQATNGVVADNAQVNSPLMVPTTESNNNFNPRMMSAGYPARVVIAPKEYYFGVIDILQTWSWSKKLERFFKVYFLGQAGEGISCMNPQEFKERYQRKIGRIVEHANIVREVTGSWQGKREVGTAAPLVIDHHNHV